MHVPHRVTSESLGRMGPILKGSELGPSDELERPLGPSSIEGPPGDLEGPSALASRAEESVATALAWLRRGVLRWPALLGLQLFGLSLTVLLFLFFSPHSWACSHCFLSLSASPSRVWFSLSPSPPLLLSSALLPLPASLCSLSQLEVLHYRLSVSSALYSPAQPSLQALHAYQVLAHLFPSPCPECMSMPGKARGHRGRPLVTQRLVPSRAKPLCLGEAGVSLQSGLARGFVV